MSLTDEQRDFVSALRDVCQREAGPREQRDALTGHGRHPRNQALYEQVAELGRPGVAIGEEYGGSGGGMVERGMLPIGGFGVSMIVAGAVERFGTDEQKAGILSEHVLRVCRTDASGGKHEGMTMLSVPRGTEGMEIRPMRSSATSSARRMASEPARAERPCLWP